MSPECVCRCESPAISVVEGPEIFTLDGPKSFLEENFMVVVLRLERRSIFGSVGNLDCARSTARDPLFLGFSFVVTPYILGGYI